MKNLKYVCSRDDNELIEQELWKHYDQAKTIEIFWIKHTFRMVEDTLSSDNNDHNQLFQL